MISFHAIILMMSSSQDKQDRHLYKKEFENILKADFIEEEDDDVEQVDQFYRVES